MLNSHCNNNGEKKNIKKIMRLSRVEPRMYGFKDHRGAMEANGIYR